MKEKIDYEARGGPKEAKARIYAAERVWPDPFKLSECHASPDYS